MFYLFIISINDAYMYKSDTSVYKVIIIIFKTDCTFLFTVFLLNDNCKRQLLTNDPQISYLRKKKGKKDKNLYCINSLKYIILNIQSHAIYNILSRKIVPCFPLELKDIKHHIIFIFGFKRQPFHNIK